MFAIIRRGRHGDALLLAAWMGGDMNGSDPCLFFSYSRADWDPYLELFYNALDRRVARALGWGERRAGFRDEVDVRTGADWNSAISAAVQASDVLVCIFTPNFFSPDKPFCAR